MPKGFRETFKIELLLNRDQKQILRKLEKQAKTVDKIAKNRGDKDVEVLKSMIAKPFFIEGILSDCIEQAPDLLETTIVGLISDSYDRYASRIERKAVNRAQASSAPGFEIPVKDVVFSTMERVINLPYFGLTQYRPNQFINAKPGDDPTVVRGWLMGNIRKTSIGFQASTVFLLVDCTDEEEEARRKLAVKEKAKKKKKAQGRKTASKWLS